MILIFVLLLHPHGYRRQFESVHPVRCSVPNIRIRYRQLIDITRFVHQRHNCVCLLGVFTLLAGTEQCRNFWIGSVIEAEGLVGVVDVGLLPG